MIDSFFLGGVELFSIRDSYELRYANPAQVDRTVTGQVIGQRSALPVYGQLQVTWYPPLEADVPFIESMYTLGGIYPLILPSGDRVCVRLRNSSRKGHYANSTNEYRMDLDIVYVELAELGWKSIIPGEYTYNIAHSSPDVYTTAGTIVQNAALDGWTFTDASVLETIRPTGRGQVTCVADITVGAGSTVWVGLTHDMVAPAAFGLGNGVGVMLTENNSGVGSRDTIPTQTYTGEVHAQPLGTRYRVIVVNRPGGARGEVWAGHEQLMRQYDTPWVPDFTGDVGFLIKVDGTSDVHRWWVTPS